MTRSGSTAFDGETGQRVTSTSSDYEMPDTGDPIILEKDRARTPSLRTVRGVTGIGKAARAGR